MNIEICLGQNCRGYGGQELADTLTKQGILFIICECRSLCTYAPVALVNGKAQLRTKVADIVPTLENTSEHMPEK